ncbi:MAG: hypothetical protein LQ341_000754 [Variospora aurantia]|nr:MAG: hypothetical protein LQ341_000754 [Variospora aurantia]
MLCSCSKLLAADYSDLDEMLLQEINSNQGNESGGHTQDDTRKGVSILVFILTILLLAADFYYLKNIAGRRLVGLRWWNEVDAASGDSHWVFESQDRSGSVESGAPSQNATDRRFFWLALYAQPALWLALAVVSVLVDGLVLGMLWDDKVDEA